MRRDLHSRVSLRRPVSISTVIQQGELKKRTAGWTLVAIGCSCSGFGRGGEEFVGVSRCRTLVALVPAWEGECVPLTDSSMEVALLSAGGREFVGGSRCWTLVAIGSSRSGVSQGEEFNVGGSRRIDWLDPPPLEGLA